MRRSPAGLGAFGAAAAAVAVVGAALGFGVGSQMEPDPQPTSIPVVTTLFIPTTVVPNCRAVGLEFPAVGTVKPLDDPAFIYGVGVGTEDLEKLRVTWPSRRRPATAVLPSAAALKVKFSTPPSTTSPSSAPTSSSLPTTSAATTPSTTLFPVQLRPGVILVDGPAMSGLAEVLDIAAAQRHTVIFLRRVSPRDGLAPGGQVAALVNEDPNNPTKVLSSFIGVVRAVITTGDHACPSANSTDSAKRTEPVGPTATLIPNSKGGQ